MFVQTMHIVIEKAAADRKWSLPGLEIYHAHCNTGQPSRIEVWKLEDSEFFSLIYTGCKEEKRLGLRDLGVILLTAFDKTIRTYARSSENTVSIVKYMI